MLERLVDILQNQSLPVGCAFVFGVLLLCGFGFPLPEDVILVTGGVLAWLASPLETPTLGAMFHDRGFVTMALVGLGGILAGDSVIYWAGRRFGRHVADVWPFRRVVTPAKLERVERLLRQRGNIVVVVARFLPGIRAPTFFTVGHSRLPYWEFVLFDGAAALVSAPLWVALGFYFGDNIERAALEATRFGHFILGSALLLAGVLVARAVLRRRAAARAAEVAAAVNAAVNAAQADHPLREQAASTPAAGSPPPARRVTP